MAVACMKISCGAVLIATQLTDTVEWSTGASGSSATAASCAAASAVAVLPSPEAGAAPAPRISDEQYAFVDENGRVRAEPLSVFHVDPRTCYSAASIAARLVTAVRLPATGGSQGRNP